MKAKNQYQVVVLNHIKKVAPQKHEKLKQLMETSNRARNNAEDLVELYNSISANFFKYVKDYNAKYTLFDGIAITENIPLKRRISFLRDIFGKYHVKVFLMT